MTGVGIVSGALLFVGAIAGTAKAETDIGFGEPQVIKVDGSTRSLQVDDLDGDGL